MKTHTLTYEDDKIETSTVRASRLDREADLAAWKAPPGKETEAAERVLDEIPSALVSAKANDLHTRILMAREDAAKLATARHPRSHLMLKWEHGPLGEDRWNLWLLSHGAAGVLLWCMDIHATGFESRWLAPGYDREPEPGSPLDDPMGEKPGGHSYDPPSNGRCPRCRGRAYVGLLSVECVEATCEEWREPDPTVDRVMVPTALGHSEACYRAQHTSSGRVAVHPVREEAIRLWKAGAR